METAILATQDSRNKRLLRIESDSRLLHRIELYTGRLDELNTVKEKVCWLLSRNSHLRDCDKCLIKAYEYQVDNFSGELNPSEIHGLTSPESIRRVRQYIQNDLKMFQCSTDTQDNRNIMESATKGWLHGTN